MVQPPLYPNSNSASGNSSQTFQVGASDPSGLTSVQLIFNWQPTGVDGCSIYYDVVNDALSVGDLTGSFAAFGQMSLQSPSGTSGDLVNSNCAIMGAGSSVTETLGPPGTGGVRPVLSLSMQLGITFRGASTGTPGFVGQQNIYMMKGASNEPAGAFQQVGTWTAYPAPDPGYYSNVAAPGSTVNQDGTVTVAFYDSNGFNYQPYAEIVFSATSSNPAADPNACRIRYDRGTGSSNHVLGLYSGDFSAAGLWGAAPVGQAGAIVQRNQNCILDIGRSYVVQESGTGASVNLALTFPTTGNNYFWMESFDRQNAGGAVQTGSLYIPPNSFTLKTSASMSQPFAVQAGSSGSFTLNAPATGTFSGNVALSYSAPAGVSVTFQANPVASPGSTTFTVAASASAAVGNGTITITGMGGGITSVVSVPFMVTAAGGGTTTYSAPATFALSGSQTLNVTGPIMGPVATFVVTATGFNGFSAGQLIGLSTDSNVKTASLSYSPLASVYAGQSVTVGLTPLGQGTPVAGGLQYCGVIDATSTGYSNSSVTLCAVINGATQSTSVAFPQPSTGYAVPVRGSIMVQAAVSQFGSSTPVSFTQSVKCPGVSNCTAGASLVSSSNGNLTIQFNAGNVPGGLSYTQQFVINNEEIDVPVYCDPGGGVVAPTIIPATSYSSGSNVVTLATDNDGSTNSANYTMSCGTYSPCGFGSMGTCVAQGAGSHVTLFQRAYGAAGATSFGFSLSATADDQATAGFYQIACSYLGSAPIAGYLYVYNRPTVTVSGDPGVPLGGSSVYTVTMTGGPVTMMISTLSGTSGQATFDDGTTSRTLNNNGTVTIVGVTASSTANNVVLIAQLPSAGLMLAQIQSSVVKVDLNLINSGSVASDNAAASTYEGVIGESLGSVIQHSVVPNACVQGTEFVGTVTPSNFTGLVILRRAILSSGQFNGPSGTTGVTGPPSGDDTWSPALRADNPQASRPSGKVYDLDAPGIGTGLANNIVRLRVNFLEYAVLGIQQNGVSIGSLNWFSRSSCVVDPSGIGSAFSTDVLNDNQSGIGTTKLTANLQ